MVENRKNLIPIAIILSALIIAGAIVGTTKIYLTEEKPPVEETSLETFAKCLSQKGMKFYGTFWCGWCNKQKELFGEAVQYLPYIECSDPETGQLTPECQEASITSFPTWQLPNGEKSLGYKPLEKLAELSGCQL